ncbi:uncharacterized protein EV420DRAFT_1540743 [Desarmillaria tabescens]|uniref:Uncharacterized protein n=1 Tax=Armillaria tabescens TaxID=1929756 RepID=A0AA39KCV4_ARMTA|nr:uncharacterized protein EV420DRAFT_1540743 [Desarmillaria tabescens]KAK0458826.1 hypothetical protein EV420DRAFT_1540743 [Desarmillaria tabescens]
MLAFIVTLLFLFSLAQGAVLLREESLFSYSTPTQTTRSARDAFSSESNNSQRRVLSVLKEVVFSRSSSSSTRLVPSRRQDLNTSPTPAPTGPSSSETTVHITDTSDFAILVPRSANESVSSSENDAIAYCSSGSSCSNTLPDGFITAAKVYTSSEGSYIQITGCMNPSKMSMSSIDEGGQFDVRYPNGAQCTFGGYGASFIEQLEPSAGRFCLRCCASPNDQTNCNSHQDRAGCLVAVPGTYNFPESGVSCDA